MEYLVTMTTLVPDGTTDELVQPLSQTNRRVCRTSGGTAQRMSLCSAELPS